MPPKKKLPLLSILFWIAFVLLVIALFAANRDRILPSWQRLKQWLGSDGGLEPSLPPQAQEGGAVAETITESELLLAQALSADVPPAPEDLRELVPPPPIDEEDDAVPPGGHVPMRQQRLFFISIDSDGRAIRQEVLKDIPRSDSPLTDALNALFAGPSEQEKQLKIESLIPQGTRLLSASVRGDVAFVNVSEEFRFNGFGAVGAIAQLEQVVFTATTFPTVSSVQILIEGQRLEYLSGEGVWIGSPLARKDFSN